jgi:hypothetical protein
MPFTIAGARAPSDFTGIAFVTCNREDHPWPEMPLLVRCTAMPVEMAR